MYILLDLIFQKGNKSALILNQNNAEKEKSYELIYIIFIVYYYRYGMYKNVHLLEFIQSIYVPFCVACSRH